MITIKYKGISDENAASTRIRCNGFLTYLPDEFKHVAISNKFRHNPISCKTSCDILYLQKIAYTEYKDLAIHYKKTIPVIYDIDDDFGVWPNMYEKDMLNIASAITTDTEERKIYLENYTKTPIYVIPDALDYVSEIELPITINNELISICTFGGGGSISEVTPYMLKIPDNYSAYYITINGHDALHRFKQVHWLLNTFLAELRKSDVCILVHGNNARGSMKSNNRLLVSMSLGIPCIVSNTPAYRQTMEAVGCNYLIANTPDDVPNILNKIASKEIREDISKRFYKYAWDNYAPQKSSLMFAELCKKLLNKGSV